ncbi:MAG: T9SS type A sorting domain-containing protein [Bacteroidetes bacterium]|nr:T9SS type A sorting domain-containing protein [Bacteroidota bacterium]
MIHNTKKTLGLLLMMLLTTGLFAQQSLLVPFAGTMTAEQQSVYSNLLALPTTKWVEIVSINERAFEDATIRLNLSPTFDVSVPKRDIGYTGIQAKTWIGTFPSMLGTATFIWFQNDRVQGHISSTEGNFELFGLGGGVYLIAEHDSEAFRGCTTGENNPRDPRQELAENPNAPDMAIDDLGTVGTPVYTEVDDECYIRMIIGYTPQAKTSTLGTYGRTMNEHIALATADANASYFNSDVETRVELAYVWQSTQNSTTSSSNDKVDLRGTTDGLWDQVHSFRDFYDGDMVGMITGSTYAGLCGEAYGFDYTDPTNMFQVSDYDCIVGNFTMDHEFGHNRGCRHDNDNTGTPFSYARGYNQGSIFRTIMAVCCSPVRVNYWSNPDINFPGGGGAMGSATRDNSRALDVGDFTVARHRVTPVAFSTGLVLTSDETLNMVTTGTLTATNNAPSGSILTLKSRTQVILAPGFRAFSGSDARVFIEPNCPGTSYARTVDRNEDEPLADVNNNPFGAALYPNPSDRQVLVQFTLPQADNISIALFDLKGRQVAALNSGAHFDAGQHSVSFDVSSLAAGHYLCNITGDDQQATIPMVIAR